MAVQPLDMRAGTPGLLGLGAGQCAPHYSGRAGHRRTTAISCSLNPLGDASIARSQGHDLTSPDAYAVERSATRGRHDAVL